MADRLKQLPKQLFDFWNKYTSKQKTIIVSVFCVVVFAFTFLIYLWQKVDYEVLTITESSADASAVIDLLKEEGIKWRLEDDRVTVMVDAKRYSDAVLLIASNDMPSVGLSLDELINNSLSTTNYDRSLKLNLYLQNNVRNYIKTMEGVEDAQVFYIPSESTTSILTEAQDTSAGVLLTTNDDFQVRTAETIAEMLASIIGNKSADKIRVTDQKGNLLYGGGKDLYSGMVNSALDYKDKLRNTFINNLYMLLLKAGDYEDVVIAPNLTLNMDEVEELYSELLPAPDQEQGFLGHRYSYQSQNVNSSGGIPGTSSNDGTDYMIPDASSNNGKVDIEEDDYVHSTRVTNTKREIGAVIPEESSMSIVLRKAVTYKEEELEMQGLLDEITFEEYAMQNNSRRGVEVDPSLYTLASTATGIPEGRITILSYEQPVFIPRISVERSWTDYLQIALAVLIVAFLIFVVFRGIRPVDVTELEPELSVEQLLATTRENQTIDDIEFGEGSEVRRMIEKFVDEQPEAVAQLLRNWLNEDWD